MSDGSLSQDEIDALLQGDSMGLDSAPAAGSSALTENEKKDFSSFLGENVKSIESNLSGMLGENVTIGTPSVEAVGFSAVQNSFEGSIVEIKMDFSDGITGPHSYIFQEKAANVIAGKMMGQEDVELNEAALSALEEAANTIAGSTATAIGELLGKTVMNAPGNTAMLSPAELSFADSEVVKVTYPVTINGLEPAQLVELYGVGAVKEIAAAYGGGADDLGALDNMLGGGMDTSSASMGGGAGQSSMGGAMGGMQNFNQANVQSVQFPNLVPQMSPAEQGNIGLLMDVYMEMTVELGRTKRLIKDILGMGEGTIIELDKLAGEPVDILVNHKLIAKGEVVVIDENFGVRVTEIVSPMDRVGELT